MHTHIAVPDALVDELHRRAPCLNERSTLLEKILEEYFKTHPVNQQDKDVVRGWLCFRELEQRLPLRLNPAPTTYAIMSKHSDVPWWRRREDLSEFIARNPHNFLLMYETGLDFMQHGTISCVVLSRLPYYLLEVRGQVPPNSRDSVYSPHLDSLFSTELESNALHMLCETRQSRAREAQRP